MTAQTKNAPANGVAAPGEGNDQNTNHYEREPIMNDATSVPPTTNTDEADNRTVWRIIENHVANRPVHDILVGGDTFTASVTQAIYAEIKQAGRMVDRHTGHRHREPPRHRARRCDLPHYRDGRANLRDCPPLRN